MAKAGGLQLGRKARRVRLHNGSPAANVHGSDCVCRASEPAQDTAERSLRGTVGLRYMPAGRTDARSVPGINDGHRNTGQACLILDEGAKLMERPRMLDATLSLPNRDPAADTPEVFEGDAATGVFGLRDQPLRDGVVHVAGEPLLLPPTLLQQALGGFGALGLEPRPQFGVASPQPVDLAAGVGLAVRVGGDVDDAKVNAEPVFGLSGGWLGNIYDHGKIENAVPVDEIGLAPNSVQACSPVVPEDNGDKLPPLERQDGYAVNAFPGQDALVIYDGSMRFEGRLDGPITLVGFARLRDGADGKLCGQPESLSDIPIDEFLKPDLVSRLLSEGNFGGGVTGSIEPLHHLQESSVLLTSWHELDHQRQVHVTSITEALQ